MNKKKIIWTVITVAMTGAFASSFFHEHDDSIVCKIFHSNGFAFATGAALYGTYYLYTK